MPNDKISFKSAVIAIAKKAAVLRAIDRSEKRKLTVGASLKALSGNYPYVCTRVRARRPLLLTKDDFDRFLLMDIKQICRSLADGVYRDEINALLHNREPTADLIESAIYLHLGKVYTQILNYATGGLHSMLRIYLRRWDIYNFKTVLRGKLHDFAPEYISENLIPVNVYQTQEFWNKLIQQTSIESLLELLKPTDYYQAILEVVGEELDKKSKLPTKTQLLKNLAEIENVVDKMYYDYLLTSIVPIGTANKIFLNFVKQEIDIVNLKTLLRLKHNKVETEKIKKLLISGGLMFNINLLNRMAELPTITECLDALRKYSLLYEYLAPAITTLEREGTLNEVILALDKYLIKQAERFAYIHLLSILPVINYMLRKKIEVDNIRAVVRGKARGLPDAKIKELLMFI